MTYPRITRISQGIFNPSEWLDEGDGLLASACLTRDSWLSLKTSFNNQINEGNQQQARKFWAKLTGLPRASFLLLGYSLEAFLKTGLAKAYIGCREKMFDRDVKSRFGHNFVALASEIDYPELLNNQPHLKQLREFVLAGARYPLKPVESVDYLDDVNQNRSIIWSQETFDLYTNLAESVRNYVAKIDRDNSNPTTFGSYNIDQDGYIAFRVGGNLSSRITYKLSSQQKEMGQTSVMDLRLLMQSKDSDLEQIWDQALILEDTDDNRDGTKVRQKPAKQ